MPMSLRPQVPLEVPEETCRIARAAFPKGTLCLRIADTLGAVYQDGQFATLFPRRGQPAAAPGRLAFATVLQFVAVCWALLQLPYLACWLVAAAVSGVVAAVSYWRREIQIEQREALGSGR